MKRMLMKTKNDRVALSKSMIVRWGREFNKIP